MTKEQATALLATALHEIAPEVDFGVIDPDLPLQEAASIDSVDFLALVSAIHDRAGIEISVRDYPRLATRNLFVSYLMSAPESPETVTGWSAAARVPSRAASRAR